MNKKQTNRGITLIALIITIIIMLILVAVSITIAINGGLFDITKRAAKGMSIEAYRENLEAIRVNAMMEQIKDGLTSDQFLDKVKEGIETNKAFEERQNVKKTKSSVKVTTKEGYLFKIAENKVTYLGLADEQGEITINLSKDNTSFIYKPDGWSKGPVKVSIETKVDADEVGAVLEYSVDGGASWQEYDYTNQVTINDEGVTIKARLYSEEEDTYGDEVEETVKDKIDRLNPKQFVPTGTAEGYYNIKLEGSTEDAEATTVNGKSGIKAYYYSMNNGTTWLPEGGTLDTSYTFEKLKDNKTYSEFKMKAVDYAGNEIITEKQITVTLPEAPKPHVGDYIDYEPDEITTPYVVYGKYSGYGVSSSKPEGRDQEISQETLNWQILKIYEDGSMDIIGKPTKKTVWFAGALGYNNGVYLLHDMCKYLYSKPSAGIVARSVSLEDFEDEDLIEVGAEWKNQRDINKVDWGSYGVPRSFTGAYAFFPTLYSREKNSGVGVKINDTDSIEEISTRLRQDGIKNTEAYFSTGTQETSTRSGNSDDDSFLTSVCTNFIINVNSQNYGDKGKVLNAQNYSTWVAGRSIGHGYWVTEFGLYSCGGDIRGRWLFESDGDAGRGDLRYRPVIHIGGSDSYSLELNEGTERNPHHCII